MAAIAEEFPITGSPIIRGPRPGSMAAINAAKTECPRGHLYSPENTYVNPKGGRTCRTCVRAQQRRRARKVQRLDAERAGETIVVDGRVVPYWATAQAQRRLFQKIDQTDACWIWTGGQTASGYGRCKVAGKFRRAHRLTYELLVGPIPEDLVLDHLCRDKLCVRPDHLEPVTDRENILRGEGRAAVNAAKTHCRMGHEFTPDNTYEPPSGGRNCRECLRQRKARWRQRERDARGSHH
jgi:HNH endonuclease